MASYTKNQQNLMVQKQYQGAGNSPLSSQMSVLAQAKPAIVSPSTTNSFSIPTGALSEKINSALNLSSTVLNQQERTDITKLFSNYNNDQSLKQQNMHQAQQRQHIEDDHVLMKQNASNQMRQAAVMAAVASQQKVRLSATERLAMSAKRPLTQQTTKEAIELPSMIQSRHPTTDTSSTPLIGSKSTSSLPTLETLLAVQRQLQRHTRQNLNSAPQRPMVNNNTDELQQEDAAESKQQQIMGPISSQQNSNDSLQSNTQYQPHAQCKKPLPPSPSKSPSLSRTQSTNLQGPVATIYEKELPPLPQSVSPSTTCTTTDESQMNSLESHQSSPTTSLVSIPPPPPPISSYLEQYDEVNSACRQSNSSTPSTIANSDISPVKQYSFVQNTRPLESSYANSQENLYYQNNQQQRQNCKPKPPILAPKPKQLDYQRVLRNQTSHFNERNPPLTSLPYSETLKQQQHQTESIRKDFDQLQTSNSQCALSKIVTDSDSNESSSASNVSYDISYKPQLNYQQHVFTRTSASLPTLPPPLPPPPSFASQHHQIPSTPSFIANTRDETNGFDEVDSTFRFPTPPPLDMLLGEDDDDLKKPSIQSEDYDEDFQCRIPTPPDQKSMSTVSFQTMQNQPPPQQQQQRVHRQHSLSPPVFDLTTSSTAMRDSHLPSTVQPPSLFRQSPHNSQIAQPQVTQSRRVSPPPPMTANPVSSPQLTVHITNNASGLLSTAANANNLHDNNNPNHHIHQSSINQQQQQMQQQQQQQHLYNHHHHMMLSGLAASSSSPSSSSDGDGQSSNSSSSTSGIHSSIDSPSSSNSKLDDFNYKASHKLRDNNVVVRQPSSASCLQAKDNLTNNNLKNISTKLASTTRKLLHHSNVAGVTIPPGVAAQTTTTTQTSTTIIKPALKQKKTVSFSDKVELVACAEEQSEDHLPNPLLARVLAGKLQ